MTRIDGRRFDQMRKVRIKKDILPGIVYERDLDTTLQPDFAIGPGGKLEKI